MNDVSFNFEVRDLTSLARQNQFAHKVVDAALFARLIQVLTRRTRENVYLLDDDNHLANALVERLAQEIVLNNVPPLLQNKRVLSFDANALLESVGNEQLPDILRQFLEPLKDTNTILFIDNIHEVIDDRTRQIIGYSVARYDTIFIGATTENFYLTHITIHGNVERRFQPIVPKAKFFGFSH